MSANKYTCNLCQREFSRNCDLTRHKNRKTPCAVAPVTMSAVVVNTEPANEEVKPLKKATVLEQSANISNKEALKSKIHEIHNYLRNNGVGYGMHALKTFNVIYGLKKIEEAGVIDKIKLKRPECEFSYLLKLANDYEEEKLADVILNDTLQSLFDSELKELLFHEITRNIRASVLARIVKEVNKITIIEKTCNVLLSGKIYEYFIGRDETAISELGAYFTDRHIVEYILEKLDPSINDDGTIPTMIDMFGGSGGFTTGYINYLNEKYPKSIKWETELSKVSHYDMNEDVVKSAALEFFCLTGIFPTMKEHIAVKNSFVTEFGDKKYKYPITNPPYGGDKTSKSDAQTKREKIREFIKEELLTITDPELITRRHKQLKDIDAHERLEKQESDKAKVTVTSCSSRIIKFALDNGKLKGNDKESCSLMLLMDIVENDGTAIGVLKEGVFFNKTYKDLRKVLIENYNVREVISIPQDQFENTSTKTSILIFDNTVEKTTEVKFRDLVIERYTEDKFAEADGDVVIIEIKGDIKKVSDTLVSTATKDELLANDINSLNGKDYNKKEIVVGKDYELVRLGDICEIKLGTRITKKDTKDDDNIPVYGGGDITFYTNQPNRDKNTLIVSRYAMSKECVRLINTDFYLNDSGMSLCSKNQQLQSYINYYLLSTPCQEDIYKNCTSGSIQKNVNMNLFKNSQIPIPKSSEKIQEWVDKISAPYNAKNTKQTQIKELEAFIQNRIKEITENEECDEVELGSVCKYIKTGKNKTPDNKEGTLYPYYGTADVTGYTNYYLFDGKHILVARNGTMGNCFLVEGKIYPSDHIFVIKNNENVSISALYYFIKIESTQIQNNSNGSIIKGISKENLSKIKIKIPKNKQLIQDLEPTFQQIEILQNEVKDADNLYKQLIQELGQEAIPAQQSKQAAVINPPPVEVIEQPVEQVEAPKRKKAVRAKKE